jgi:hypothetical protein
MDTAIASPTLFFDDRDLIAVVEELSHRVRCDSQLAPIMKQIVGNRWSELELGTVELFLAKLKMRSLPDLSVDRLNRAIALLSRQDCRRLHALFIEAVFARFPLHDASNLVEVADDVLGWIQPLLEEAELGRRQRKLLNGMERWRSNTL